MDTTKDTATATRIKRGIALVDRVEEHGDLYTVEASGGGFFYTVDLEGETCSCKDHERRGEACKHIYAAIIFNARGCRKTARPKVIRH